MRNVFVTLALGVLVVTGCNTQSSSNKGPGGKELKLTTPKTVTIAQDDTAKVEITIERTKFDDPVTVKFETPEGVSITEGDTKLDKGVKERTFTLKATNKAKVGKSKMTVVASGADMKDTHEVTLEVKEKSTSSTSGSSPVSGTLTNEDLKREREKLGTMVQEKMKEIDTSLATLRERAKTADAKVKVDLNKRIEELHTQRENLGKEYEQLQTTTAANWNTFSTRLSNAAHELAKGARKALDQFNK